MNTNPVKPYIITHSGRAHRDEFLACCILLARIPAIDAIHRRQPKPGELNDPNCIAVDVGGIRDLNAMRFDAKLPGKHTPECALSLVLQKVELYDTAKKFWPWVGITELREGMGLEAVAERMGSTPYEAGAIGALFHSEAEEALLELFSAEHKILRVGNQQDVLNIFGTDSMKQAYQAEMKVYDAAVNAGSDPGPLPIRIPSPLFSIMKAIGLHIVNHLGELAADYDVVRQNSEVVMVDSPNGKVTALWFKSAVAVDKVAIDQLHMDVCPQAAVVVNMDHTGPGSSIFRFPNNSALIDLAPLAKMPGVSYAHPAGRLIKTKARLTTTEQVVAFLTTALDCIKNGPPPDPAMQPASAAQLAQLDGIDTAAIADPADKHATTDAAAK